jgi:hypothetical protein
MTIINRRVPNVIVPLDDESADLLYRGQELAGRYIALPIGRSDLQLLLSRSGLIEQINNQLGTLIDEYEEGDVSGGEKLEVLQQVVLDYRMTASDPVVNFYCDSVLLLVGKAIEYKTGVHFFF